MSGASQALGHGLQAGLEAVQVDEGGHESRDLDVGRDNELGDELLEGGQAAVFASHGSGRRGPRWRGREMRLVDDGLGWRRGHHRGVALDDVGGSIGEVGDHCSGDGSVDEMIESSGVELSGAEGRL